MKKIIFLIILLCKLGICSAQVSNRPKTLPLISRMIGGVILDSAGKTVNSATVTLISKKDTLQTATTVKGVYVFEKVQQAEFILTIRALGYGTKVQKYLLNDTKSPIQLDTIILKTEAQLLREVTIKGRVGPKYLKDTVEFWAADYIVRDYARLEDLLKKMEGVMVDK